MSEDLVRSAYRTLLGREPENDIVVRNLIGKAKDSEAILRAFVESTEFRSRFETFSSVVNKGFSAPRLPIETDVSPVVLLQLFNRIKAQWKELGEREPYWSVVTSTEYLRSNYEANQAAFNESGREHAAVVDYLPARNGIPVHGGTCLELGCGVGRMTRFLAEKFDRVIAVDISPANLKLAQDYLGQSGVTNVDFQLICEPSDIGHLKGFDFFYSFIVLQHNPPPVQKFILESVFRNLGSGGCALFQTPTYWPDYGFAVDTYLDDTAPLMEMHALPMNVIFAMFEAHGLSCKEVVIDTATGIYGSHTFVASKY